MNKLEEARALIKRDADVNYRKLSESHDVSFEELEAVEKLIKTKKLTDKQKEAIRSLLKHYYYSTN